MDFTYLVKQTGDQTPILNALYQAMLDGIQAGLIVLDRDFRLLACNRFMETWVKRDASEMWGQQCFRLFHGREAVCEDCPTAIAFRTGELAGTVHTGIDSQGGQTFAELASIPIHDSTGRVVFVVEQAKDVSERMLFEQAILDRNLRLSALNAIAGIVSGSQNVDEILEESLAKMVNVIGGGWGGCFLLDETADQLQLRCRRTAELETIQSGEGRGIGVNETIVGAVVNSQKPLVIANLREDPLLELLGVDEGNAVNLVAVPLCSQERTLGIMSIVRGDERRIVEEDVELLVAAGRQVGVAMENASLIQALRGSEQKYRTVVEFSNDVIWTLDLQGNVSWFNRSAEELCGKALNEAIGKPLDMLILPEDRPSLARALSAVLSGQPQSLETRVYGQDGKVRVLLTNIAPVFADGVLVGTVSFGKDITERIQMAERLVRAQRLEMAGQVAGQVAHDFNNMLGPLLGYPGLIKRQLATDHPAVKLCDNMIQVAKQMANINADLLTLGRRGHFDHQVLNLNRIVYEVLSQMAPTGEDLVIKLDLSPDLLLVKGSDSQLIRVITNLVANAREAMQEAGTLTVGTENVYIDLPIGGYNQVEPGEYVKVTIDDEGSGIDPQIRERIFDPFFTTKRADRRRGSGLGLSVVQSIVDDHRGYVDVESELGKGSTFSVYLPVCREPRRSVQPEIAPGGNETILVIDDDEVQREVVRQLLRALGYRVEVADSGESALSSLRVQPADLLLVDMIMPGGIDGTETYRQALDIKPGQQAIILSGYSESDRVLEAKRLGAAAYLRKPVSLEGLAQVVREVLDRQTHRGAT